VVQNDIAARLVRDLGDTRTVPLAAAALSVEPGRIVKSLLFLVQGRAKSGQRQPVLVIVAGDGRVDYKAIARHFGVSRKKVRMAPGDVVLATTGYAAGGVPPFGHRCEVPTVVDAALVAQQEGTTVPIYAGGGDESTMLEITVAELLRVVKPTVIPLSAPLARRAEGDGKTD
jgi:prolyl-tRNA editing enzyme YbaK/EbsC (Cys-tRNA(Pro) deacylase)